MEALNWLIFRFFDKISFFWTKFSIILYIRFQTDHDVTLAYEQPFVAFKILKANVTISRNHGQPSIPKNAQTSQIEYPME